jgi:hypothetical protein
MKLSSCRALFALVPFLLSWTSFVSGYQLFQPASGFFVCPGIGSVCNVKGCDDGTGDKCSTIANGFNSSLVDGVMVYTSHTEGADLVIVGGNDSAIKCHADCKCQSVTRRIAGCSLPSSDTQDDFFALDIVTDEVSTESAAKRTAPAVGGLLVAAVAIALTMALA